MAQYKYPLFLGLFGATQFVVAQVDLSAGLVAHYPFSGDAADSSGNGNNGVVYGALLTDDRNGTPNSAYYFDGATAHIEVANAPALNPALYTISSIVKPMGYYSGWCQGNVIVWKGRDISVGHYGLMFSDQAYDNGCAVFDSLHQNFYNSHGFVLYDSDTPFINTNQWYCVLSTYDGDSLRMYVDGTLRYKRDAPPYGQNSDGLSIGKNIFAAGYDYWLKGVIDEIRLYDRVLNDEEIDALCGPSISTGIEDVHVSQAVVEAVPNPVGRGSSLSFVGLNGLRGTVDILASDGRLLFDAPLSGTGIVVLGSGWQLASGIYRARIRLIDGTVHSTAFMVE